MESPTKAHVIVGALPFISHLTPMRTIAQHLVACGYQVTVITAGQFRKSIGDIGATPYIPHAWENFEESSLSHAAQRAISPSSTGPIPAANVMAAKWFINAIPLEFNAVQEILASSKAENPGKPAILLPESSFLAILPIVLGAPGLHPKGVISVGNVPILTVHKDTAPPCSGLLPDSSPKGLRRNEGLNNAFLEACAPIHDQLNSILRDLGAMEINQHRQNAVLELSNLFLQLCPKSLEYPRSDAPPGLRFTGGLPRNHTRPYDPSALPDWWNEISNHGKNRIVAVSQGTVALEPEYLIIPTLEALKGRENIIVIVALGKRGATLPPNYSVPENARVADWIPFDDLLPMSDVFVTNGGYGSFQNALSCGVPLVIAPPYFADKRDIAGRVEWSGTGINLRTGSPTQEALREAVLEVFGNEKYKKRALEIKAEIETYDPIAIIANAIDEVAGS